MDEIIKSLSEKFNLSESSVRSAAGVLLKFLKEKSAGTEFEEILAKIPGAMGLLASAPTEAASAGGGLLGGLMGAIGGGDLGKVLSGLQSAGVPMEKIGPFAREFLKEARDKVGSERVDEILNRIPMLKNLLG